MRRKSLELLEIAPRIRLPNGVSTAARRKNRADEAGFSYLTGSVCIASSGPTDQSSEGMKTATNPPTFAASAITSRAAILDRRMSR